jgi:multidrug efflux pump
MNVYFQPVQDIQISTRASRAQYQYTLVGTDAGDVIEWSEKLADRMGRDRRLLDVASEAQEGGLRMQVQVDRETAAGSASPCRRSMTRSTTPSASVRSRRSIRRPTSIA